MPITPLPTPPQPTDTTAQFNTKAFAFVAALAQFVTESNIQAAEVDADAVLAQLGKTEALAAAAAAAAVAGATRWTSATTYAQGAAVWSPITFLTYRRRNAGAGTTDPSADSTNWAQVAGTGDVSQTGVQTLTNKTLGSGSVVATQAQGNNSQSPASTAYVDRLAGTAGALGFRNRIINGDCRIAQRSTSATTVSGQYVAVDRFRTSQPGTTAVVTMSQSTDAPAGFQNSLRLTVGTADASVATGDAFVVQQLVEGFNCADLIGQPFTLSFWVRSAKTGVHCVSFANAGADRSFLAEYTVNAANTWEYKTITVTPGLITAGTTNYTNGAGVDIRWSLMGGATFQSTAGAWNTGNFTNTASQVNVLDAVGNIFAITGVQLEAGVIATPFERVDYSETLRRCQRYLPAWSASANTQGILGAGQAYATTAALIFLPYPVQPRTTPSGVSVTGTTYVTSSAGGNAGGTTVVFNTASLAGLEAVQSGAAGLVAGNGTVMRALTTSAVTILATGCEL